MKRLRNLCGLIGIGIIAVLGCNGTQTTTASREKVIIDGSSSLGPVTEVAAEEFDAVPNAAKVGVSKAGTGTGMKRMIQKDLDICDASRPIKTDEMEKCKAAGIKYFELPICYDALTVVIHPENTWAETMTVEQLGKLWKAGPDGTGEVQTWDQIDPSWPKEKVELFGADDASGTFEYFGEAIAEKKHRTDYSPSPNDNLLVEGVSSNKHALGYIPYTYYASNKGKLKAVKVVAKGGTEGVEPSPETALSGKYTPLARPLFIYVPNYSAERAAVKQFVEFYLQNAESFAKTKSYLPLSKENYDKALARFKEGKTGTVFGGHNKVGITADELLAGELTE